MTGRVDGKGKKRGLRRVLRAPLLIGAAASAGLLIAPTVSSAFASHFDASPVSLAARGGIGSFTPASIDPRLAAQITVRALSNGKLFRFTPAGTETRPDRAVTVAVRVNDDTSRVVSVRQAFAAAATTPGAATVRIAPTAYNLASRAATRALRSMDRNRAKSRVWKCPISRLSSCPVLHRRRAAFRRAWNWTRRNAPARAAHA
jgi:hypothetical protein